MARIAGINIPPNQHAEIGLTAIYGIGRPRAREILEAVGVEKTKKVKEDVYKRQVRTRKAVTTVWPREVLRFLSASSV